jgi:hypothetical protein
MVAKIIWRIDDNPGGFTLKLVETFNKLIPPELGSNVFSAESIKNTKHKIAKDGSNCPFIMIAVDSEKLADLPPQSYYNLEINFNKSCLIQSGNDSSEDIYSVIGYKGDDEKIKEYFLKISEIVIKDLGVSPSQKDFLKIVDRLTQLFKTISLKGAKQTIQGLWAELFLILHSDSVDDMISAWHSDPKEKFDFSLNGLMIEAKSTSRRSPRSHIFKQEQLDSIENNTILIASIITEKMDGGGKSIPDLIEMIEDKVKASENVRKLHEVITDTLRDDINKMGDTSFNLDLARDTFRIFNGHEVPQFNLIPPGISEVSFRASLEDIDYISDSILDLIKNYTDRQ